MGKMTIDEAITHARKVERVNRLRTKHPDVHRNDEDEIEVCLLCAEEHEQLAEWLEELKMYKSLSPRELVSEKQRSDRDIEYHKGFNNGYNKAIDDYMNKLCDHCMQQTNECYKLECPFCTDGCDIVNIAEQLKEGVADAGSI